MRKLTAKPARVQRSTCTGEPPARLCGYFSNTKNLIALALVFAFLFLMFMPGCAAPPSSYTSVTSSGVENATKSTTLLSSVLNEWRLFAAIFMFMGIVLVAMVHPIANALNMPDLKAWAEVELGEAFTTALIVAFIIVILIFAEFTTHALVLGSSQFKDICNPDVDNRYCPALIAKFYIHGTISSSNGIYEDLQQSAMETGKLAMLTVGGGSNYWMTGFPAETHKVAGYELIKVNMLSQETQFLMTIRDALFFQEFMVNGISLTLAPMALLLGIILRSFFLTRKLGGLLMAFGIGFMLVFPATYAIAMYTLKATVYGAETTGGVGGPFCTDVCMRQAPAAYNEKGDTFTEWQIMNGVLVDPSKADDPAYDYEKKVNDTKEFLHPRFPIVSLTSPSLPVIPHIKSAHNGTIYTCGIYDALCPQECRALPYPNTISDCSSRGTEYICREIVPEQCFDIKYIDPKSPQFDALKPEDWQECPVSCRSVLPLKKTGCDIGYGFNLYGSASVNVIDAIMAVQSYPDSQLAYQTGTSSDPETLSDANGQSDDDLGSAMSALEHLGFEDLEPGKSIQWKRGCPNECRWMLSDGTKPIGGACATCHDSNYPAYTDAKIILQAGQDAAAVNNTAKEIAAAKLTCVEIIPSKVYTGNDCQPCSNVLDRGFAMIPPIHMDCQRLCGAKAGVSMSNDIGSMLSNVGGFKGPAEMKSIAALITPALILPLLNLAVTFMFIQTLSPILGGGMDISGITGLFK